MSSWLQRIYFLFENLGSKHATHGRVRASPIDSKINDADIAEAFRSKFSNVSSDGFQLDDNAAYIDEPMCGNISDWLLKDENIDNAVFIQMKSGKAAGIDNLCPEHIIFSHPSIIVHLCKVFQVYCLNMNIFLVNLG
jgi:hypothetical protein